MELAQQFLGNRRVSKLFTSHQSHARRGLHEGGAGTVHQPAVRVPANLRTGADAGAAPFVRAVKLPHAASTTRRAPKRYGTRLNKRIMPRGAQSNCGAVCAGLFDELPAYAICPRIDRFMGPTAADVAELGLLVIGLWSAAARSRMAGLYPFSETDNPNR